MSVFQHQSQEEEPLSATAGPASSPRVKAFLGSQNIWLIYFNFYFDTTCKHYLGLFLVTYALILYNTFINRTRGLRRLPPRNSQTHIHQVQSPRAAVSLKP